MQGDVQENSDNCPAQASQQVVCGLVLELKTSAQIGGIGGIMRDCPGEDLMEDDFIAAEEDRLKDSPLLKRMMNLISDREKIESRTVRELGKRMCPHPPMKPWNIRVLSPKERERAIGEATMREKFVMDIKEKLKHRHERVMSECGRIVPSEPKPRRCSQRPKLDNWLGRRWSRARAATLVRRASEGGALRGSTLLQRGSVFLDHRKDSIRRATMRRQTMLKEQTGAAVSKLEAHKIVNKVNFDNVVDMSVAVQNTTDSLGRLRAVQHDKEMWNKISPAEYTSTPLYDWKIYKSDLPRNKFGRTEDYLQSYLRSYKNAPHGLPL